MKEGDLVGTTGGGLARVLIRFSLAPDGQRAFLQVGAGLQDLLSVAPPELEAHPNLYFDLIHCDDRGPFEDLLDHSGNALADLDLRFAQYTREGDLRRMHLRARPERLPDGTIVWEGVQVDITAQESTGFLHHSIGANPDNGPRRSRLDKIDVPAILKELEQQFEHERAYLDEDICLEELARRLRVSPHALSELLNRRLGVTYYEYVSRWRVAEACRLLCEAGGRTILQIGYDSGFRSKVAFHEAFKRFTSLSPGEYRKKRCNEETHEVRKDLLVPLSVGSGG